MFSKIKSFFYQPYPLFLETTKVLPAIIITSLFVVEFLSIFQPFGLAELNFDGKALHIIGYGPLIFFVLSFNFFVLTRLFPNIFQEERWVVWKESAWILWHIFTCIFAAIIYQAMEPNIPTPFSYLLTRLLQAFLVGMIPETLYVSISYALHLHSSLAKAERLNEKLQAAHPAFSHSAFAPKPILKQASPTHLPEKMTRDKKKALLNENIQLLKLFAENDGECVHLPIDQLLFIQSSDNYANIVWLEKTGLKKTLLRSSLKRLSEQIQIPFVIRCHRSFIVNLAKVLSVEGNARGYRLFLDGYQEAIPVARNAGKHVLKSLEKLAE